MNKVKQKKTKRLQYVRNPYNNLSEVKKDKKRGYRREKYINISEEE